MEKSITDAIALGASLDGPIKYPTHGKVSFLHYLSAQLSHHMTFLQFAAIRSFDGHMFGLFQPA
jgi:hypothetical protein